MQEVFDERGMKSKGWKIGMVEWIGIRTNLLVVMVSFPVGIMLVLACQPGSIMDEVCASMVKVVHG